MSRYFFHVANGEFIPDAHGIECETPDDVKREAVRITGSMIKDQGLQLWRTRRFDMFVCDDQNKTHLKLSFTAEDLSGSLSENGEPKT